MSSTPLIAMNTDQIFDLIVRHAREVLPDLESRHLTPQDSLRDLGANSIDRSEIIMMTLEALRLRVPLVELAGARNMGELAALIQARQESRIA